MMKAAEQQRDAILTMCQGDVAYGATRVLHVSGLSIVAGSVLLLHGRNGTGKSSLLKAIAGVAATFIGDMKYRGVDVSLLGPHKRASLGMRLLPQGRRAFGRLTIHEHLRLAHSHLGRTRSGQSQVSEERHDGALDCTGFDRLGDTLSGGEARLLILQSLLVGQVYLLLLDEPYAGMDADNEKRTTALIQRYLGRGAACIIADHTGLAETHFPVHREYVLHSTDCSAAPNSLMERPPI